MISEHDILIITMKFQREKKKLKIERRPQGIDYKKERETKKRTEKCYRYLFHHQGLAAALSDEHELKSCSK